MKFFLDSANLDEIRDAADIGIIDGLTTNPSLIAKNDRPFSEVVKEIFSLVDGPISLEVIATEYEQILEEGRNLSQLNDNVVVKVPMLPDGIKAVKTLSSEGIKTNVTLVFSATQALLAAKAGATFVSPFVGRLHDISHDGTNLINDIRLIYDNYDFQTEILVASDRTPLDTLNAALIGADIITLKYENFQKLFKHPLTDTGLQKFLEDWDKSGQNRLV
jgi:transaldolase